MYGDTGSAVVDEDATLKPPPERAWRLPIEQRVLAGAERGIRPVVIRPCFVYGRGGGVAARMVEGGRRGGLARYIDDGQNRFSTIHVDDLADLYLSALQNDRAAGPYNATATEVTQRQLAEAVGRLSGVGTASWSLSEARGQLGVLADTMAMTVRTSAARAQRHLSWKPWRAAPVDEIEHGSYHSAFERPPVGQ